MQKTFKNIQKPIHNQKTEIEQEEPIGFTKFTKDQQDYLNSFADAIPDDPTAIHDAARITSKILDRPIIVIDENGKETIYDESQNSFMTKKPIILKHDGFTNKWTNMDPLVNSEDGYDNIFAAISSKQSDVLRKATQEQIKTNPSEYLKAAKDYHNDKEMKNAYLAHQISVRRENLSFDEFKQQVLKENPHLQGQAESYIADRAGLTEVERAAMQPSAISQAEIDHYLQGKYYNYLNGREVKDMSFSTIGLHATLFYNAIENIDKHFAEGTRSKAKIAVDFFENVGDVAGKIIFTIAEAMLDNTQSPYVADNIRLEEPTKPSQALKTYLNEKLSPIISDYVNDLTPESRKLFFDSLRAANAIGGALTLTGVGSIIGVPLSKVVTTIAKKAAASISKSTLAQDLKILKKITSHSKRFVLAEGILETGTEATKKTTNTLFNMGEGTGTKIKPSDMKVKTNVGGEKVFDSAKTTINNAISDLDIKKFGGIVEELTKNAEFNKIASRWGIGKHKTNQLLEHTLGYIKEPQRLASLELKAGLKAGALTDMYSTSPIVVVKAMKNFDNLALSIKNNPTHNKVLQNGQKLYWKQSSTGNLKEGMGYIEYNGKPQTLMRMDYNQYEKY